MTKSLQIALQDLEPERIWVLYPGEDRYPLHARVEALPLRQLEVAADVMKGLQA